MTGLVIRKLGKLAPLWYENFLSPSKEIFPFESSFPCMGRRGISDGLRYYFKHFPPQKTSYDFEQNTFSMPSICGEKSHKCVVWLRIVFFGTKSQTNFSCTRINTGNILEVKVVAAAGTDAISIHIFAT